MAGRHGRESSGGRCSLTSPAMADLRARIDELRRLSEGERHDKTTLNAVLRSHGVAT